jgi:ketosteroid isomerase-like protein
VNPRLAESPLAMAVSFIDCINRGDVAGLGALMHPDHELIVFDEEPTRGRQANIEGWKGYAGAYPQYLVYPHRLALTGNVAAILGHTTGSHLGLSDEEESRLTLIWLCELEDGAVRRWTLVPDTPANRETHGLSD